MFLLGLESRFVVFFCLVYFPIDERSKYKIGSTFLFTIYFRCWGRGLIKGSFIDGTAVHGCHCPNLTTALLAQLGERRSAERVVC